MGYPFIKLLNSNNISNNKIKSTFESLGIKVRYFVLKENDNNYKIYRVKNTSSYNKVIDMKQIEINGLVVNILPAEDPRITSDEIIDNNNINEMKELENKAKEIKLHDNINQSSFLNIQSFNDIVRSPLKDKSHGNNMVEFKAIIKRVSNAISKRNIKEFFESNDCGVINVLEAPANHNRRDCLIIFIDENSLYKAILLKNIKINNISITIDPFAETYSLVKFKDKFTGLLWEVPPSLSFDLIKTELFSRYLVNDVVFIHSIKNLSTYLITFSDRRSYDWALSNKFIIQNIKIDIISIAKANKTMMSDEKYSSNKIPIITDVLIPNTGDRKSNNLSISESCDYSKVKVNNLSVFENIMDSNILKNDKNNVASDLFDRSLLIQNISFSISIETIKNHLNSIGLNVFKILENKLPTNLESRDITIYFADEDSFKQAITLKTILINKSLFVMNQVNLSDNDYVSGILSNVPKSLSIDILKESLQLQYKIHDLSYDHTFKNNNSYKVQFNDLKSYELAISRNSSITLGMKLKILSFKKADKVKRRNTARTLDKNNLNNLIVTDDNFVNLNEIQRLEGNQVTYQCHLSDNTIIDRQIEYDRKVIIKCMLSSISTKVIEAYFQSDGLIVLEVKEYNLSNADYHDYIVTFGDSKSMNNALAMKYIIINELSYDIIPFSSELLQNNHDDIYEGILWEVPVSISVDTVKRALQLQYFVEEVILNRTIRDKNYFKLLFHDKNMYTLALSNSAIIHSYKCYVLSVDKANEKFKKISETTSVDTKYKIIENDILLLKNSEVNIDEYEKLLTANILSKNFHDDESKNCQSTDITEYKAIIRRVLRSISTEDIIKNLELHGLSINKVLESNSSTSNRRDYQIIFKNEESLNNALSMKSIIINQIPYDIKPVKNAFVRGKYIDSFTGVLWEAPQSLTTDVIKEDLKSQYKIKDIVHIHSADDFNTFQILFNDSKSYHHVLSERNVTIQNINIEILSIKKANLRIVNDEKYKAISLPIIVDMFASEDTENQLSYNKINNTNDTSVNINEKSDNVNIKKNKRKYNNVDENRFNLNENERFYYLIPEDITNIYLSNPLPIVSNPIEIDSISLITGLLNQTTDSVKIILSNLVDVSSGNIRSYDITNNLIVIINNLYQFITNIPNISIKQLLGSVFSYLCKSLLDISSKILDTKTYIEISNTINSLLVNNYYVSIPNHKIIPSKDIISSNHLNDYIKRVTYENSNYQETKVTIESIRNNILSILMCNNLLKSLDIDLLTFGSSRNGLVTKGSDIDLILVLNKSIDFEHSNETLDQYNITKYNYELLIKCFEDLLNHLSNQLVTNPTFLIIFHKLYDNLLFYKDEFNHLLKSSNELSNKLKMQSNIKKSNEREAKKLLYIIADLLQKSKCYRVIENRAHARVKLIRVLDIKYNVQCDIVLDRRLGIHNSDLIYKIITLDNSNTIYQYLLLIKLFVKSKHMNDASKHYISSYGWILLGLHILFKYDYLPNYIINYSNKSVYCDGFNVTFNRNIDHLSYYHQLLLSNISSCYLFQLFLYYYSNEQVFNRDKYAISLRTNRLILNSFSNLFDKSDVSSKALLCIEDPFEHFDSISPRDVGCTVDDKPLKYIYKCISHSYNKLIEINKEDRNDIINKFKSLLLDEESMNVKKKNKDKAILKSDKNLVHKFNHDTKSVSLDDKSTINNHSRKNKHDTSYTSKSKISKNANSKNVLTNVNEVRIAKDYLNRSESDLTKNESKPTNLFQKIISFNYDN